MQWRRLVSDNLVFQYSVVGIIVIAAGGAFYQASGRQKLHRRPTPVAE